MEGILGTAFVGLILAGIVTAIIVKLVKDKRRGKSCAGCPCGCADGKCPGAEQ